MNAAVGFLLLCGALSAYGLPSGRIVGGHDAPEGKHPYIVSLRYNGEHFCGGSIISKRFILTAAHCLVVGIPEADVFISAGTNRRDLPGTVYEVDSFIVHEDYNPRIFRDDIGLIKLKKDIVYTDLVKPIKYATGTDNFDGRTATLSGWGRLQHNGEKPRNLQEIVLTVYPYGKCAAEIDILHPSNICTFTMHGQGSCSADSGGPLVADNGVQIGIVSYGVPCAVGYPDVYTRVSSYKDWIDTHTQSL